MTADQLEREAPPWLEDAERAENPADLNADVWKAYDQIWTYKEQIGRAFPPRRNGGSDRRGNGSTDRRASQGALSPALESCAFLHCT
jgi:hypothetical protein